MGSVQDPPALLLGDARGPHPRPEAPADRARAGQGRDPSGGRERARRASTRQRAERQRRREDPVRRDVEGPGDRRPLPDRRRVGEPRRRHRRSEQPAVRRVRVGRLARPGSRGRARVQPRLDRVRPVRLHERRLCDAARPHGRAAGIPLRPRRGAELLAGGRAAGAGDRGAELRLPEGGELAAPPGVRLRAVRELVRPGLRGLGQGGRARRPAVGRGGGRHARPGRARRRRDDPGLLHVLLRRATPRTTRTSGAARRSRTSAGSATQGTTRRRTRTPSGRRPSPPARSRGISDSGSAASPASRTWSAASRAGSSRSR